MIHDNTYCESNIIQKMKKEDRYILEYSEIDLKCLNLVGGKNASLGEMIRNLGSKGVLVPAGFTTTAKAYWDFLDQNNIRQDLDDILKLLKTSDFSNLNEVGEKAREKILNSTIPESIEQAIRIAYQKYCAVQENSKEVAVRSSATAEDLPNASFAGQQETYLNISGEEALLVAFQKCLASLFTARAIKYRIDNGFEHMDVALSVGVQHMVRADKGSSGVVFTLDPETGFRDVLTINGVWGLGENLVQGVADPDEFIVFKTALRNGNKSIISKKLGLKQKTMIYGSVNNKNQGARTINIDTSMTQQRKFVLKDEEVEQLAKWSIIIEEHYGTPMDIEWAKDGLNNQLYIVQARPETVHSIKADPHLIYSYKLKEKGEPLASGIGLGDKIATGKARILDDPKDAARLKEGEVLITDVTNPDWDPIMKKAAAIVTNRGGRTSHAAIVARELGVVSIVGSGNATEVIKDGQLITVSCAEGKTGNIYDGALDWETEIIDTRKITLPRTQTMFILANPENAFKHSFLPNNGVGLLRMEFIISNSIQVHPMALVKYNDLKDEKAKKQISEFLYNYDNPEDYFTDQLSQAVGTVAAAFYPKDVIVRMSDFKTNEYANLIGGREFEPEEENPMLGFRGASRYYNPLYKEGFRLECEAMKIVRDEMGLINVKLMIPFCRTIEEGQKVINLMGSYGLKQGHNGLEIYTMIEVPSNVILAEEFAEIFDGFSIGSNDLTQLTLGLDRDSDLISPLFDENNKAVRKLISEVIQVANVSNTKIGLCGQAPSDFPEFAKFLVESGIDSISFVPDALIKGIKNIQMAEQERESLEI